MKKIKILLFLFFFLNQLQAKPLIITDIKPVEMIVKEITGTHAEIFTLTSNSTDSMRFSSSDLYKLNAAGAFIYISDSLEEQASAIANKNKINLFEMLPEPQRLIKDFGAYTSFFADSISMKMKDTTKSDSVKKLFLPDSTYDYYFWTDPVSVKKIIPALIDTLAGLFPDKAGSFNRNAARFEKRLDLLDRQISVIMDDVRGMPFFQSEPKFNYFAVQYDLSPGGCFLPEKELPGGYSQKFKKHILKSQTNCVFYFKEEPLDDDQLNFFRLDLYAASGKAETYSDFILQNAKIIAKAIMFY